MNRSERSSASRSRPGLLRRMGWLLVGLMCVGLGGVGVVVPGLPSTVFFIGAAAAFARCSPRLEAWVLRLPKIGPMVRDYRAGRGMPRRVKVLATTMILVAVTVSSVLITGWIIRMVVVVAGLVGVIVVLRQPTAVFARSAGIGEGLGYEDQ